MFQIQRNQLTHKFHRYDQIEDLSSSNGPDGPLLEERTQKVPNRAARNTQPVKDIQVRNSNEPSSRQSVRLREETNRRIVITDDFHQASVFERLGTRSTPPSIESRGDKVIQAKPKPPNYSRINSTIRMFQPTAHSSSQQAKPVSSYASAVKSNLNFDLSTTSQSTLKSTTDMPRQVANESSIATSIQVNQEARLPFKLIPVVPPQKSDMIKTVAMDAKTTVSKSTFSKSTSKRSIGMKPKFKSVIRPRALSPVPEDMQVESTTRSSNVKELIQITNYTINDQRPTDFEMIIESDLQTLTEDAIDSQEIRENTAKSMLVDNETDELTIKSSVEEGLSTPDRPSGPLLEEMPSIHVATEVDQPIVIDPINVYTRTMPTLESAVVKATTVVSTELNILQQAKIITEESPVSVERKRIQRSQHLSEDINSISETSPSVHNASTHPMIANENPGKQLSTPERSSDPSFEEQFPDPVLHSTMTLGVSTVTDDSEVESFNPTEAFESLEDLTVYEVIMEYQASQPTSTTNYPRVFLQLQDGQIIDAESGEIIISLSQFVATSESAGLIASNNSSIATSQPSPRPLQIDSEFTTSTQEDIVQQVTQLGETSFLSE